MTIFDIRTANLRAINSMTKYPSIPTYHALDPRTGSLLNETVPFLDEVVLTEKVDGCNARIICLPDGSWLLGSREELLYARGDLIGNPALGIVDALRPVAHGLPFRGDDAAIRVYFLEVYGGKVSAGSKQYTRDPKLVGWRLFDIAVLDGYAEMLTWPAERISGWRDGGGQRFLDEEHLLQAAVDDDLDLVPWLSTVYAMDIPTDLAEMRRFLGENLPGTEVALGDTTPGSAEGMVLRSPDRSLIAKARFQDYDRTLKRRAGAR